MRFRIRYEVCSIRHHQVYDVLTRKGRRFSPALDENTTRKWTPLRETLDLVLTKEALE
jgi:hypothetical protein